MLAIANEQQVQTHMDGPASKALNRTMYIPIALNLIKNGYLMLGVILQFPPLVVSFLYVFY